MAISVEKCIEGWTNSLRQMRVKADIVFYGDSLIYYGNFSSLFPDKVVCNLGLRGDTIKGLIDRIEQVSLVQPSIVFLMAGINDVANETAVSFKLQYERLLNYLQVVLPNASIVVQSLLPVNNLDFTISCSNEKVKDFNAVISCLSDNFNLKFLDLYSLYQKDSFLPSSVTIDGIHLKEDQYDPWYRLIKETQIDNNFYGC